MRNIAGGELKFDSTKAVTSGKWDGGKLKGNLSFNIAGIAAGTYDVYMKAGYSSGNGNKTFINTDSSATQASRYVFQIDDASSVAISDTSTYEGLGFPVGNNGERGFSNAALCSISIPESAAAFKILFNSPDGYSVYMAGLRLVKTA